MGITEILIILGISLAAGFGTVEYQKARTDAPFQSPALGYSAESQPYLYAPKIKQEDA